MKETLMAVLTSLTILTSSPNTIENTAPSQEEIIHLEKTIWTEDEILSLITRTAEAHEVSAQKMIETIKCEAPWRIDSEGNKYYDTTDAQSRIKYNEGQIRRNPTWGVVGEREKSFGPAQIHLPTDPSVTKDQASDPEFAVTYMAREFKNGRQSRWMCYK